MDNTRSGIVYDYCKKYSYRNYSNGRKHDNCRS
jgi:hypothetical protein